MLKLAGSKRGFLAATSATGLVASVLATGMLIGCAIEDGDRSIAVTEANALGITELTVHRGGDIDGDRFELRGFDATGTERASVELRIGEIEDLAALPGGDRAGSEILLAADGEQQRLVSRERSLFRLTADYQAPIHDFLTIEAVTSELARSAHIEIARSAGDGEVALSAQSCPSSILNTSPLAEQCCYTSYLYNYWWVGYYTFYSATSNRLIGNSRSLSGVTCKASDGVSSCLGQNCYFGPNGNARPSQTAPTSGSPYPYVFPMLTTYGGTNDYMCQSNWQPSPPSPAFGNVTGSFPTGQGCPGGNSGAGQWD